LKYSHQNTINSQIQSHLIQLVTKKLSKYNVNVDTTSDIDCTRLDLGGTLNAKMGLPRGQFFLK